MRGAAGLARRRGRCAAGVAWLASGALAAASPRLAAQAVEGRVADRASGEPVRGAYAVLADTAGVRHDADLTRPDGAYRLEAPGPGSYRIRIQRIGLETGISSDFEIPGEGTVTRRLEPPVHPVRLPDLPATAESECALEDAGATEIEHVWREIRKALRARARTRGDRPYRYRVLRWERLLSPGLEVRAEEVRTETGPAVTPFVSPSPEREIPDIEGVLWVDRTSAEPRRLDFSYVNAGLPRSARHAGGRIDFLRLPAGTWIVSRWFIRMPVPAQFRGRLPLGLERAVDDLRHWTEVAAYREVGGRVDAVEDGGGVIWRREDASPSPAVARPSG